MHGRRSPLPEQVHDHAEGAFIHDIRKRVLPLDLSGAHVKLLVPHQIGKDQDQGLPVHMVGDQDPDRIQDLTADDPCQKVIFILKMIIESHADDTGAVRDLFDGYFLKRRPDDQFLETVRKRLFYIPFSLQKYNLQPL